MYKLKVPRRVWRQVASVFAYTEQRFGGTKRAEYEALVDEALVAIGRDPSRGKRYLPHRPEVLGFHIQQTGRNARHLFFYYVARDNVIRVLAFLYDSMDFERHVP
jgi:plasmid stabilization system protein ParE